MRRLSAASTFVTAAATALVAVFAVASPAAAEVSCTSTIGATTIEDDVVVPGGATCRLDGTIIDGNVLIGPGASLTATGVRIDGNIQDDDNNAGAVTVVESRVGGNIQLEDGTSADIRDTRVDGDLQFDSNRGQLRADGNTVGGNLQAEQNRGGLTITGNEIDGDLQCASNEPAPTGGDNVVHGSAEGQCADLSGAVPEGSFEDVPANATHAEAIDWLVESGITQGCTSDGRYFCPGQSVTRAQMASFLDRALDLPDGSVDDFDDVDDGHTHAVGIGALVRAEVTGGCTTDGTLFCPNDPVTRAQMATFLDRALDLPAGSVDRFDDVDADDRHAAGIGALVQADITTGCNSAGTRFCPDAPVTRAQMATFLQAALR